jgi:hypothetical protein
MSYHMTGGVKKDASCRGERHIEEDEPRTQNGSYYMVQKHIIQGGHRTVNGLAAV